MKRYQDRVFACVVMLLFFSAIGYSAFGAVFPDLGKGKFSSLEQRSYTKIEDFATASFIDETAQGLCEQLFADSVPFREPLVFFNAGIQRCSIKIGAKAFGIRAYPTYFGSGFVEVPRKHCIVQMAMRVPTNTLRDSWISTLNEAAQSHPKIRFSFTALLDIRQSAANPTHDLISGELLDSAWAQENLVDKLDPSIDATVDEISSTGKFVESGFSTDLHWNQKRALRTYNRIGAKLGWEHYGWKGAIRVAKAWYGTNARTGRDLRYSSELWDLPYLFDNLEYYKYREGEIDAFPSTEPGRRPLVLAKEKRRMRTADPYNVYQRYHGAFNGLIVNKTSNNKKTLLFICDSNSHCLKRYVAQNYRYTYVMMPGNATYDGNLEDYIMEYDPDDIVVLMHSQKYQQIAEYSPKFIGLEAPAGVTEEEL